MTRRSAPAAPAAAPEVASPLTLVAVLLAPFGVAATGDVIEGSADRIAELIAAGGARAATAADVAQAWPRVFAI